MSLVVGGLGGGGDAGLASIIVEGFGIAGRVSAVASFARCRAGGPRGIGARVAGALVRVPEGPSLDRRLFEDKLRLAAPWAGDVYLVCVEEPWSRIQEAVQWLVEESGAGCLIHGDIGGDGLLTGYERRLGSYKVDAVARAALAWASQELGARTVVAVGAVGAEGGGAELDLAEIYASLAFLHRRGAVLAAWRPSTSHTATARALLSMAESGMLPILIAAIEGRRSVRVDQAYLHGVYEVKPWYSKIVFLDAMRHCELSPLCRAALGRGLAGLRGWSPPAPLREYRLLLKEAAKLRSRGLLDLAITRLLDEASRRHWSPARGCP